MEFVICPEGKTAEGRGVFWEVLLETGSHHCVQSNSVAYSQSGRVARPDRRPL